MAFVVARPKRRWEIRESRATPSGPRSRTLATFRVLTPEVLQRARERAFAPVDEQALRASARRQGAPAADSAADRAAGELLEELVAGRRPAPGMRARVLRALRGTDVESERWAHATLRQRADALADLLVFVDALPAAPARHRSTRSFPRLDSGTG